MILKKISYKLLFVLSLLVIVTFTILSIALINRIQTERNQLEHRRRMELELGGLSAGVHQMQSSLRGYIITRNALVIKDLAKAERKSFKHLIEASFLTANMPLQHEKLQHLKKLFEANKLYIDQLQVLYASKTADSGKISAMVMQNDSIVGEMNSIIATMLQHEDALVKGTSKNIDFFGFGSLLIAICFGVIAIIITIFGFLTLTKENREKRAAERASLQTAEALEQSEVSYKNLNDSSNDAIIIAGQDGLIISWNKTATNIFGYSGEEAIGKPIEFIMPERYHNAYRNNINDYIATGRSNILGTRVEMDGLHKNGTEFPIEITLSHWKVDNKHYFSGAVRDIAAQRKAQEKLNMALNELRRSNEDLEQFAYVASHDLQEPLRKIQAFGDRLAAKYMDNGEAGGKEYVLRMMDAAGRMQALIVDLLSFSTVSKDTGDKHPVDLNETLKVVLDDLQVAIAEAGATIKTTGMPVLDMANPMQMHQLFLNLLSNAIKFRKAGQQPEINVTCKTVTDKNASYEEIQLTPGKPYYEIEVTDNGIGFDNKYFEKIFTIFHRLHGRTEYKGTGIGLALCRKICNNHGGFITARGNENGATFVIFLPA